MVRGGNGHSPLLTHVSCLTSLSSILRSISCHTSKGREKTNSVSSLDKRATSKSPAWPYHQVSSACHIGLSEKRETIMSSGNKVFWVSGLPPGSTEADVTGLIPPFIPATNVMVRVCTIITIFDPQLHSTELCSVSCSTPELALMVFNVLNGKSARGAILTCAWGNQVLMDWIILLIS